MLSEISQSQKDKYCMISLMKYLESSRRRQWHPTPVVLPGKSHGWRSLEGCSPWSRWGSDMTEWLHFYFSLSCIGEGSGNPLQCSCLENPRDGGAWWAALYGVAQSRTRLSNFNHFSLSCIGEGSGNPLQCSCLENPRDVGSLAGYGVAQSRTWLKRLSSSFSAKIIIIIIKQTKYLKHMGSTTCKCYLQ